MGEMLNRGRLSDEPALRYEDMTPLQQAKADLDYIRLRRIGGFAYKQAKAHYEKLLRKEKAKNGRTIPTRSI